jgi:hypothetical protein
VLPLSSCVRLLLGRRCSLKVSKRANFSQFKNFISYFATPSLDTFPNLRSPLQVLDNIPKILNHYIFNLKSNIITLKISIYTITHQAKPTVSPKIKYKIELNNNVCFPKFFVSEYEANPPVQKERASEKKTFNLTKF